MPGGLSCVLAVEHEQPAVPRRRAQHHAAGEARVVGNHRAREAAPAAGGQADYVVGVTVANKRAYWAERLDLVRLGAVRAGAQQDGGDERAAASVGAHDLDVLGIAVNHLTRGDQRFEGAADLLALLKTG